MDKEKVTPKQIHAHSNPIDERAWRTPYLSQICPGFLYRAGDALLSQKPFQQRDERLV